MHTHTFRSLVFVLLAIAGGLAAVGLSSARAQDSASRETPTIDSLAWLAGDWRRVEGDSSFDERWMPPAGGTMAALSRQVTNGKTGLYELSVVEPTENGLVLRIRHFGPGLAPWKSEAGGAQSWPLAGSGKQTVVFEDPENDFPRRIVYTRSKDEAGKDTLTARLDAGAGSQKAMEFRFRRVD